MAAISQTSRGLLQKFAFARRLTHRRNNSALLITFRAITCKAVWIWTPNKGRVQKESVFRSGGNSAAFKIPPPTFHSSRWMTSVGGSTEGLSQQDVKKRIDEITDMFMEARELLSDASAAKDTIYFNEDLEDATAAVKETLELYNQLLEQLTEEQRNDVVGTIGLKMEELKAQEAMLQEIN